MAQVRKLTYQDLLSFPDDGLRHELIDGEEVVSPSPVPLHQRLVGVLFRILADFVERVDLGEVFIAPLDILFSEINVLEPDLFFISQARAGIVGDKNVQGVPDLVIEVVSNSRLDRVRKRGVYEQFGVPEYWIVDPDADRVEVYTLTDGRYPAPRVFERSDTLVSSVLAEFELPLARLFK